MKLHSLKIEGFRRIRSACILLEDATFLIGANNSGKSTAFKAIEYLLSAKKAIPSPEYYSVIDDETGETKPAVTEIVLEAEFRNLPDDAHQWRGFKGRIFNYTTDDEDDSGLSVTYRKTFKLGVDVKIEFRSKERELDELYADCKKGQDYIDKGIDELIDTLKPSSKEDFLDMIETNEKIKFKNMNIDFKDIEASPRKGLVNETFKNSHYSYKLKGL